MRNSIRTYFVYDLGLFETKGSPMPRRLHVFILTALTALVSLALFFAALVNGWFGPYSRAGHQFCETMRPGLIKQPANTWSNLGFVAAGLSMAWSLARGTFARNRNALTQSSFNATFFSCLVVLLGPGSMALHASGTELGGFIDVLSMYLVASFLAAYSAQRLFRFGTPIFALAFFAGLAFCIWADKKSGWRILHFGGGNIAFAFFLTLTTVFEAVNIFALKIHQTPAWGFAALGAILLAFFIWNMSRSGCPWCVPDSLIQGHAAWHLLDALSVYCLFRYYVSEQSAAARQANI